MVEPIGAADQLQVGGALLPARLYIEREEDARLKQLLLDNEFCHVLAPSQTGKTSLARRTAAHLETCGIRTVHIDFNARYLPQASSEDFYFEIMRDIAAPCSLEHDFREWIDHASDPRLQPFFLDFLLPRLAQRVVVFFDEFDDLLEAPFRQEFLLQLRALFNARSTSPELSRVTFCLIGTLPTEIFFSDSNRTAFNVVQHVLLSDFSADEVGKFAALMRPITPNPAKLLDEIYDLTGGHPYMLQKVLRELIRGDLLPVSRIRSVVSELARKLFMPNHDAVVSRIGKLITSDIASVRGEDKLRLYQALWESGELDYRPQEPVQTALRLIGAAGIQHRDDGAFLVVRNRVVADTFDDKWIAARFQDLYSPTAPRAAESEVDPAETPQLRYLTQRVDELFCSPDGHLTGLYQRRGPGKELLRSTIYHFPLETTGTTERVSLQVFVGIEGLGGQLWEQEVRALLRLNTRKHDTLPTIRDGGYYQLDPAGANDGEVRDLAYIVTDAGKDTLAVAGAMEHFRSNKVNALAQFNLLAEGLAILHGSGLMHRNLHPGTVEMVARDMEGTDTFLRMARFEMAPLIANLLRRLDPAFVPDGGEPGSAREMNEAIRSYYLDEGANALVCVAPERLGSIYELRDGGVFEGSNADVFSLGVLAYQWFIGQLPPELLQDAFGKRSSFSFARWEALFKEMDERLGRAPVHKELKELLRGMLDINPRTRWQSAEIVDFLARHYDAIVQNWADGEKNRKRPYLIVYLAEEIGDFLRRHGFIYGDPRQPAGRAELHRFLIQDLGSPTLSFAPSGCAPLVSNPDEPHRKSRYVLQGTRLAYFAHIFEERALPQLPPQEVPQALVIRYSVEQTKVRNVNMSAAQRKLPSIDIVSRDGAELELARRAGRPLWKPVLDSIERASGDSPEQLSFLRALEWLLELQSTRLDARTYPVRIDPENLSVLVYDGQRDLEWLSRTDLGSLYQGDRGLRPDFCDHFEQEAYKKGNVQLSFWCDDRGSPDYKVRPVALWFSRREGKDSLRVDPYPKMGFSTGWLQIADDQGTRYQIEQQRRAYFHLARMPDLINQLQRPTTPTSIRQRWPGAGHGLDGRAPAIISKLLDSRPLFALQGPPGTGKTTVISHAVQQAMDRDRNIRILVAAQSHYALDNLLEKIHEMLTENGIKRPDVVRIVSPKSKDRTFSKVVKRYFIEQLVDDRKRMILNHCDEFLESESHSEALPKGASEGQFTRRELVKRWRKAIESSEAEMHDRLRRGANLVFTTTGTATESYLGSPREEGFDWVIVDEAAKAWPTELVMPLVHGQRWALVGDHKQIGPFAKSEVESVLSKCQTSRLEELRQVGAQKARFLQVYEVFKNIIEGEDKDENTEIAHRNGYLERPVEVLKEQYRMHPAIAELISRRFYDNKLVSARSMSERKHQVKNCEWLGTKAIVWVDTTNNAIARESADPKWNNPVEANIVLSVLNQLGNAAQRAVVLSPYNAQVKKLSERLTELRGPKAGDSVYTVDGFQGREADIVIVSMVRCNDAKPDELFRRLGFMVEDARVNVLFSRSRQLLIIVGCFDQFYKSESPMWPLLCEQIMHSKDAARVSYLDVMDGALNEGVAP